MLGYFDENESASVLRWVNKTPTILLKALQKILLQINCLTLDRDFQWEWAVQRWKLKWIDDREDIGRACTIDYSERGVSSYQSKLLPIFLNLNVNEVYCFLILI